MIEYNDAQALVVSAARTLPAETVPLARALGRTLARDVKAREDIPPFTKATMDGFAVRAADTSPARSAEGVPAAPGPVTELTDPHPVPCASLPGPATVRRCRGSRARHCRRSAPRNRPGRSASSPPRCPGPAPSAR
ncbi:MAG: hypothetical protein HGA94_06130, partial [Candidatus Aminicenantes bacterium]|nr:hypothetical protein [Candidatus Aminicenantes bacterium]